MAGLSMKLGTMVEEVKSNIACSHDMESSKQKSISTNLATSSTFDPYSLLIIRGIYKYWAIALSHSIAELG